MAIWKIITLACTASLFVTAKHLQKHETTTRSNICEVMHNNTNKIQCYCSDADKFAECYITQRAITFEDKAFDAFRDLAFTNKITFTNTKGFPFTFVPTKAITHTTSVKRLEIKFATINTIFQFAFANHSNVEEIVVSDNQIVALQPYAFAHHKELKLIGLDTNSITEINRNIFVDLPKLEQLYLTNNQISTIHDKAFIHLHKLNELEMDGNKIFSLNYATFEGLVALEKLEISRNSLEVIGENTFSALSNLKSLNLDGNKIQVLDEKAFNGLGKLLYLSLAHNSLIEVENEKVFAPLVSLTSLSLKGNQIKILNSNAMAPILKNFFISSSSLDVEENSFACDCRLDWSITLKNNTKNKYIGIAMDNIKCTPDANLKDEWTRKIESEKNNQLVEDEDNQATQGNDYEYYDESQLNGTLFYSDVRTLMKCDGTANPAPKLTKEYTSPRAVADMSTMSSKPVSNIEVTSTAQTRFETTRSTFDSSSDASTKANGVSNTEGKPKDVTTVRLATVSAKPAETMIYDNMASDEAKPDKIKAHRSIQDKYESPQSNSASRNLSYITVLVLLMLSLVDC